jgi:hypothetical protein
MKFILNSPYTRLAMVTCTDPQLQLFGQPITLCRVPTHAKADVSRSRIAEVMYNLPLPS